LRAEPFEGGVNRLALRVDFAGVEGFALGLVAQDLVGAVDLGKALGRLGIVAIGVGVQFLASRRNALLIAAGLAERCTPKTS
jgi:hypothetical protein